MDLPLDLDHLVDIIEDKISLLHHHLAQLELHLSGVFHCPWYVMIKTTEAIFALFLWSGVESLLLLSLIMALTVACQDFDYELPVYSYGVRLLVLHASVVYVSAVYQWYVRFKAQEMVQVVV